MNFWLKRLNGVAELSDIVTWLERFPAAVPAPLCVFVVVRRGARRPAAELNCSSVTLLLAVLPPELSWNSTPNGASPLKAAAFSAGGLNRDLVSLRVGRGRGGERAGAKERDQFQLESERVSFISRL